MSLRTKPVKKTLAQKNIRKKSTKIKENIEINRNRSKKAML